LMGRTANGSAFRSVTFTRLVAFYWNILSSIKFELKIMLESFRAILLNLLKENYSQINIL
jgi:hypothetical protein